MFTVYCDRDNIEDLENVPCQNALEMNQALVISQLKDNIFFSNENEIQMHSPL